MDSNGERHVRLVHETRKTIKRMRALARLLRPELGEQEFRRVNASLGEAGHRLTVARDAEVRAATLRALRARHPERLAHEQIDALAARLERSAEDEERADTESIVMKDIGRMRGELLRWAKVEHDPEALADGLRLIYRDGRRRYRQAKRSGGREPERMHDWRKRVKALYYALDTLGAERSPATAALARRANRLGDLLGEEHDLWMLAACVRNAQPLDEPVRALVLDLIEHRRGQLREQSLALGARIYERKPKRFAGRTARALAR